MTLADALAVFDEPTLVALANKGTVRRAASDLEAGLVTFLAREGETATIIADGETVRIDARGPAAAACSCPAKGICRHRIGAVLLVRREAEAADTTSDGDVGARLIAEIAALPAGRLERFAGRAAFRAAVEIAQAGAEVTADGSALVVRLASEPVEIRYLPGLGPEGMVSKAVQARRKILHTAALIAIRRQAGIGSDEPMAVEADASSETIDPAFLAEVRAALAEACTSALSLAPLALEERLFALSVSSRADALQRLGALLRIIARMMRERRSRSFRFDPDLCLAQMALADAIARALPRVSDPERRAMLIGSARQDYDETGPLSLMGVGAEAWRTEGGARGVTAYLYAAEEDRWFVASLARGAGQDPDFNPARAYQQEAIWGGSTLAKLIGASIVFESVAASRQGRLSLGGSGRPHISMAKHVFDDWRCAFSAWRPLGERLRERLAGSQLSSERTMELVLLRPRRSMAPWLDELTQMLNWPVEDNEGNWLALSIPYNPDREAHFDALVGLFTSGFAGSILAGASIAGPTFALRPIALLDAKGICSLDLDPLPPVKEGRSLREGIRSLFARRGKGFASLPKSASMTLLDDALSELTGIAEMGCRGISPTGAQRLEFLAQRGAQSGLDMLARAIKGVLDAQELPSAVLQSLYPIHQLRRQLTTLPIVTPQS